MNKHILLVMKWLNNPDYVNLEGLKAIWEAADRAVYSEAWIAAYLATCGAANGAVDLALRGVDEYFKITNEDRSEYERELNK
jgi:hypothetical protein|tara:strand:- start:215 stop:460 length:246 start_codon:yes stop_codon:yes gene_type:complete